MTETFVGKPCKRGHTERYAKGRACVVCKRTSGKAYNHKPEVKLKRRTYVKSPAQKAARSAYMKRPEVRAVWRSYHRVYGRKYRGVPDPTRPEPLHCEICGGGPGKRGSHFDIDHCHETGAFRGWLCNRCNRGIGMLGDNLDGVLKAVEYFKRALPTEENQSMLSNAVLQNLHKMLDRVTMTGNEALAWVEAKGAIEKEIMERVTNVPKAPAAAPEVQAAVQAALAAAPLPDMMDP